MGLEVTPTMFLQIDQKAPDPEDSTEDDQVGDEEDARNEEGKDEDNKDVDLKRRQRFSEKTSVFSDLPKPNVILGLKDLDKIWLLKPLLGSVGFDLSERHDVDKGLQEAGLVPEGAEEYAFVYPGYASHSFLHGAFVYFKTLEEDEEEEVVAIKEIVEFSEADSEMSFDEKWVGDVDAAYDCPSSTQGWHSDNLFKNVEEFCWMPECKVTGDRTLGCFMYKLKGGEHRAYVTHTEPGTAHLRLLPSSQLLLGLKTVGNLDTELGDISEKHKVSMELLAAGFVPEGSEEYAFAYPSAFFPNGAFVYYWQKGEKVIAIKEIVESSDGDINMIFDSKWTGKLNPFHDAALDCPSGHGPDGYHPVALTAWRGKITLFDNVLEFCWMPECKVTGDKRLGCFMFKMNNGEKRAYVTRTDPTLPALSALHLSLALKNMEELDAKLGDISEKHAVNEKLLAAGKLPEDSKDFAFAYPIEALPHGAFVYYDKDSKVISIKAITAVAKGYFPKDLNLELKAAGSIKNLNDDLDCPSNTQQGYHDVTLFEDAEKFCWMPECKVISDRTNGCFMFKMKNHKYRAFQMSSALKPVAGIMALVSSFMADFW